MFLLLFLFVDNTYVISQPNIALFTFHVFN